MGWLALVTIHPKKLLQTLHAREFEWTQTLEKNDKDQWREMYSDLQKLVKIHIPRYVHAMRSANKKFQFHCFSDASKDTFAAVVYLHIVEEDEIHVNLVIVKSRVAPLDKERRLTIPKLELLGAILATRLLATIRSCIKI